MKSDGENMNITSIVIIKRVIGFTCVILLLLTNVYAQENEISIDLELVSVSVSYTHLRAHDTELHLL